MRAVICIENAAAKGVADGRDDSRRDDSQSEGAGELQLGGGSRPRDRDIAVRIVAEGKSPDRINVGEIASRELVTIDAAQELAEALRLMAKHQVRRLPVVEKDGKLIGIVARADVAKHATSTQTGEVVEKISN